MYIETVHNDSISVQYKLGETALGNLNELSWIDPRLEIGNFYKNWQANSDQARLTIPQDLMQTLAMIYRFDPNQGLEVNLNLA